MIKRDKYVDKLLSKSWNGKVKIITGIRRCGKSFLLNTLYKQALMERGVKADCFIEIDLERGDQVAYRCEGFGIEECSAQLAAAGAFASDGEFAVQ